MTTESILSKIETSRKDLLDLSLRNPLLNYRTLRARGVETIDADPVSVFRNLVRDGKKVSFVPEDEDNEGDTIPTPTPRRGSTLPLHALATPGELQRRLITTYRTSNTIIQEQGVNTLFIALGMVIWRESESSETDRCAPLVFVPVQLDRANINSGFTVSYTGEDLVSNISFAEKARADFRLDIPLLDEDEDSASIDLKSYFRKVKRSIRGMKEWSIDATSVVLGFFTFTKFLMYRDMDSQIWPPGSGPLESEIIRALFEDGFSEPEPGISEDDYLDDYLRPQDAHHVVDADSSQSLAIVDANSGRNLVIQGPPGTGKSQTITNVIAEAIGQGKKVLFVSEKMAALEVVKRRLDELHVGDACLELHSHKTTKRIVLDELKRTLELGRPNIEGIEDDFATLKRIRDGLNRYAKAVNDPVGNTGVSPFDAYGELKRTQDMAKDTNLLPRPDVVGIDSWSRSDFDEKSRVVSNLQNSLRPVGILKDHPFWGSGLRVILPYEVASLRQGIYDTERSMESLINAVQSLANAMSLDLPKSAAPIPKLLSTAKRAGDSPDTSWVKLSALEWENRRYAVENLRDSGLRWDDLHSRYDSIITPDAWEADVIEIRNDLADTGRKFLKFLYPRHRRAKKRLSDLCRADLPTELERQLETADAIIEERELRETVESLSPLAASIFRRWQVERANWEEISQMVDWSLELYDDIHGGKIAPEITHLLDSQPDKKRIQDLLRNVREALRTYLDCMTALETSLEMDFTQRFNHAGGLTGLPFTEQGRILNEWLDCTDDIRDIAAANISLDAVAEQELHAVIELVEEWPDASERLTECFELTRYERILSRAFNERPDLRNFNGSTQQSNINLFIGMDNLVLDHNRARVSYSHWDGLPKGSGAGQIQILRREFEKKSRHLPIRQLMTRTGNAVQAIKPVFMMSPLSIATYLAPGSLKFDLVIFDEASQVRPTDALGALMRADQAVVVGDDRQLPPTSFFDSVTGTGEDEDEDNFTTDIESILGMMRAAGCPSRMLRWHYRSRHESLIAVSNREFYQNGLVVFPSPDSDKKEVGLQYHHLPDTVYDRGGSRTNRGEAREVAEAVMWHARQTPNLTLGVSAFSTAQMNAILDELERLRREDDSCESFFNDHPEEPFFVKNLENVQGDERDVIFISVGYGRDSNGNIAMNFGPLNRDGGERRLNVIITRARMRCHVFTNLSSEDINLGATRSIGVRAFKTFLAYAESGILPSDMPSPSGREVESPFQRAVASRLRSRGYEVHEEVASGGKFIDIAIVDPKSPGRYLIGIECDGATYHSSISARDRDKIREQVLIGLGWKLHRIWSTDWFLNEDRELKRAVEAIEQAKVLQPVDRPTAKSKTVNREIERADHEEGHAELGTVPYKQVQIRLKNLTYQFPDVSYRSLQKPITDVVRVEGPIHVDEIIRRIADAADVRATRKVKNNLNHAITNVARSNKIVKRGKFLWLKGMKRPIPIRDRSAIPKSMKIDLISPEEISESVKLVVKRSFGIDRESAVKEAGRLLGFKRVSKDTRTNIDSIIEKLVRSGDLNNDAEHLTLS